MNLQADPLVRLFNPPRTRLVGDVDRVFDFVSTRMPMARVEGMRGLGLEKDGKLIAGVLYEGFNGRNVWMHVAAIPGAKWMTRQYLRYCFHYPFNEMGVDRISGYVNADNEAAIKLDEHLGFKREAVLTRAAPSGADVYLYVMWKSECRYVKNV